MTMPTKKTQKIIKLQEWKTNVVLSFHGKIDQRLYNKQKKNVFLQTSGNCGKILAVSFQTLITEMSGKIDDGELFQRLRDYQVKVRAG